jgi:hypothetical protein
LISWTRAACHGQLPPFPFLLANKLGSHSKISHRALRTVFLGCNACFTPDLVSSREHSCEKQHQTQSLTESRTQSNIVCLVRTMLVTLINSLWLSCSPALEQHITDMAAASALTIRGSMTSGSPSKHFGTFTPFTAAVCALACQAQTWWGGGARRPAVCFDFRSCLPAASPDQRVPAPPIKTFLLARLPPSPFLYTFYHFSW